MPRTVIITGASKGIGEQLAYWFAKENAAMVLCYHDDGTSAEEIAKRCLAQGATKASPFQLDVRDARGIAKFASQMEKEFAPIDILINNAGVAVWKQLREQSAEEIENQLRTNLEGPIKLTAALIPHIREAIVNVASGAGKTAYSGIVPYCATKFGLRGFTQGLAREHKVRVLTVNPGMTATRMTGGRGDDPKDVARAIYDAAVGTIKPDSNLDVDAWEYL